MLLQNLIKISKFAVVAKITRVIDVDGFRVAEAEVITLMKGNSETKKVYFKAQPIWACDISNAIPNETVLLFLESEPSGRDESSSFSRKLRETIGNHPFFFIAWEGRGRIPIIRKDQNDYLPVNVKYADVKFPKQIRTIPMLESEDGSVRLAKLHDVIAFVKKRASGR